MPTPERKPTPMVVAAYYGIERISRKIFDVFEQSKEFAEKGAELYANG